VGSSDRFTPWFAKKYADLHAVMGQAFQSFIEDVAARGFPAPEQTFHMSAEEFQALLRELQMHPAKQQLAT